MAKFVAVTVMLVLVCYVAEAQYVQDGLLGYWSFDADTIDGKTVSDSSGNGNHAEANFDLEMVEGKIGDALLFGGGALLVMYGRHLQELMTGDRR